MTKGVEDLGEIRETFRPKMANIGAGFIIGLGLLVGGITVASFIVKQQDSKPLHMGDRISKYALAGLLGVGAPIGGIALLVSMKRLASHRVTVHERGFSYTKAGSIEICPWSEIEKISEALTHEQLQVFKIPGAAIKNIDRSFALHRNDGKVFNFTVNSIDSIPRFAECLEEARDKFSIPWERIEMKG
jgi:hypothetical protein